MKAATIGLDIPKQVFQVHGADKRGKVVFRCKLRRGEVTRFFAELEPCLVGMEASGSAHDWARMLTAPRHGTTHGPTVCEALRQIEQERC